MPPHHLVWVPPWGLPALMSAATFPDVEAPASNHHLLFLQQRQGRPSGPVPLPLPPQYLLSCSSTEDGLPARFPQCSSKSGLSYGEPASQSLARFPSWLWLLEDDRRRRETLRPLSGTGGQLRPTSGGRHSSQLPARKKGQGKRATCCIPLQIVNTLDSVLEVLMQDASLTSSILTVEKILQVRHLPRARSLPCLTLKRRHLLECAGPSPEPKQWKESE